MISGGIASGGHSDRKRRRYANNLSNKQVFKIEKRFAGFDVPITFSDADFGAVRFPHDDALVLALKMKSATEGVSRRVKRVLVDKESSADILYKSTFDQMGLSAQDLSPAWTLLISFSGDTLYSLGTVPWRCNLVEDPAL
jgi:hypothetical protein